MKTFAYLLGLAACIPPAGIAEPVSLAGLILPNAASAAPYVLQRAGDGAKVAALTDPRGLLTINEWVILQAEITDMTAGGLSVLEVVDILPEHWAQPGIWDHFGKGFGAWSGFGNTVRAENYAGVPYEERRAYYDDNASLSPPLLGAGSGTVHPPVVLQVAPITQGMQLTWNVQSGAVYDVLGSRQLTAGYTVVSNFISATTGSASITVPVDGSYRFFKIRY